ncbi:MAG: sigma-70 family RNA polymerase sigma factor, partial [Chitinophagaceae bacterium]
MPELPPMPANHLEFSTTDLPVQLAQKNKHAFSYTYDSYAPALFGFITRTVNDTFAAEEILQNVFVKIWNHADSYCSEKGSLFTWMMAITRNEAITHLRSKTTRKLKRTVTVEGRDKYNRAEGNSREIADDVKRALK